tara:strand:+ start:429268 stop:429705 length:438 start_codon:yes stop_codon:yes gene_type:complete
MDASFLGIPDTIWFILLAIGFVYGQIKGAYLLMQSYQRSYRNKKLADWPDTLRNARTVKMKADGDNAILLERTANGDYVIKHVFANAGAFTVTYKHDVINGTQAYAERVFEQWVANGLSDDGRVDGFKQTGQTYQEPKNKGRKRK